MKEIKEKQTEIRTSRLLNLELDYKLNNQNFIFNYNEDDEAMSKCTCGFITNKPESSCPKCNTNMSCRIYQEDIAIKDYYVKEYSFDSLKGVIKLVELEAMYDSANKEIIIDQKQIDFVFKYELNKSNRYTYKPEIIIDGESFRMLKSDLEKYGFGATPYSIRNKISDFGGIESNYSQNFQDTLWSINNKYKHCPDALKLGIYEGYDYELASLKSWNIFIKELNEKDLEYLKKYANSENRNGSKLYIYNIRDFFTNYRNDKEKLYRHIDILLELKSMPEFNTDNNILPYSWRDARDVAEFMVNSHFTIDELKELFDLAHRQAYDIGANHYNVKRVYRVLNNAGMPIDKKPKELAIYMNKMKKLIDMNNNHFSCTIEYNDNMLSILGEYDISIIKRIYEKFSYKGLDKVLFDRYMKNKMAPLYLKFPVNKDKYESSNAIAFFDAEGNNVRNTKKENIIAILTEDDRYLEDKQQIEEYLTENYNKYNSTVEVEAIQA